MTADKILYTIERDGIGYVCECDYEAFTDEAEIKNAVVVEHDPATDFPIFPVGQDIIGHFTMDEQADADRRAWENHEPSQLLEAYDEK